MSDLITIESAAQAAKVTWRTAKKRLVEAGVKPVRSTRKSELYEPVAAMRAVLYPEADDQAQIDALLGFVGSGLMPAVFSTQSAFFRHLLALLRSRGCTKAEALLEAGTLLLLFGESVTRECLPGRLSVQPPDWLETAAEEKPGVVGMELMQTYVNAHWPDDA